MNIWKIIEIEKAKHDINSDKQLATACGWSPQNYHDKKGRKSITLADIERIANAMNCDLLIEFKDRE